MYFYHCLWASQVALVVNNLPACQSRRQRDSGSIPGSRRSPGGGHGNPRAVFLPGESHGQRSRESYSQWGRKGRHDWSSLAHLHPYFTDEGTEGLSVSWKWAAWRWQSRGPGCTTVCATARVQSQHVLACSVTLNPVWPHGLHPPQTPVHGISQARILEWVAIFSSRGSSGPRDWTWVSCIGRWILYHWAIREAPILSTAAVT